MSIHDDTLFSRELEDFVAGETTSLMAAWARRIALKVQFVRLR